MNIYTYRVKITVTHSERIIQLTVTSTQGVNLCVRRTERLRLSVTPTEIEDKCYNYRD